MIAGRSIVGLAVGSASFVVPLYISELSPSPFRGRLVVVTTLFITGGQVVAYLVGWGFSMHLHGWRWTVGLGALPAAMQFCMLWWMPETPRWLMLAGRQDAARGVLRRVYGREQAALVGTVLRRVGMDIRDEEVNAGVSTGTMQGMQAKASWTAKLDQIQHQYGRLVVGGNRRALIIACLLQGAQHETYS